MRRFDLCHELISQVPLMFSSRVAAASRVAIVVVAAVIIALGFLGIGVAWLAKTTPRLPRGGRAILRS
jgi:VIT1/CCC1 family predicted Fe2+/Mn2+ transporter